MDVCGEGRSVTRSHMLALAKQGDVPVGFAQDCLERALHLVDALSEMAKNHPIRQTTLRTIRSAAEANRARLGARGP